MRGVSDLSSGDFQALLKLQQRDALIDQLRYKREHLPVLREVEEINRRAAELRPALGEATTARDDLASKQSRIEAEVEAVLARIAEINARLYGDTPVPSKDAQAMLEEIKHLNERQSSLEDNELEIMEQREPVEEKLGELEASAKKLATEMSEATTQRQSEQSAIDQEIAQMESLRESEVAPVPAALIDHYELLRKKLGGVAVAELVGNACGGCHLTLAASEVARIRKAPESEIIHCEECGRILVR